MKIDTIKKNIKRAEELNKRYRTDCNESMADFWDGYATAYTEVLQQLITEEKETK